LREKSNHIYYPRSSSTSTSTFCCPSSVHSSLTSSRLSEPKSKDLPLNHFNLESTSKSECLVNHSSSLYSTKLPNDYSSSDNIDKVLQENLEEKSNKFDIARPDIDW
jgi:hypothetical protein